MAALLSTINDHREPISPTVHNWTDEEFMAFNRDGHRYEIVNGEL